MLKLMGKKIITILRSNFFSYQDLCMYDFMRKQENLASTPERLVTYCNVTSEGSDEPPEFKP